MSERKQVILFMTDTTRKDMLGCYGDSRMITPNLDRLAQEGIRYENAYSIAATLANGIWMVAIISAMENVRKAGIRSTGMICGAIWKS